MPNGNNERPGNEGSMRNNQLSEPVPTGCQEKEYFPPRTEMLKEHEININFFNVGCVVRVGCKTVAFNTTEEAMKEINEYVANPKESRKKWNNIFNKNE